METEPIETWPPKPSVQSEFVEIGEFHVFETPERLTVRNIKLQKALVTMWGFLIMCSVAYINPILRSDLKDHLFNHMTVTQIYQELGYMFALPIFLFAVFYMTGRKSFENMSEPLMVDRAVNELVIQRKKCGSFADLHSLEMKRIYRLTELYGIYAVTADPRNSSKELRVLVTQSQNAATLRQVAQVIADFSGVPVIDKPHKE